ncbi:MAG: CHAT domain-containing protein [Symploca sp. SIO1B1]|nr:CHAT domain-containing protein [Symploca sp. SIO1B1]
MMSTRLKYQWILWNKLPRFAYRSLAFLMGVVFATATSTPISAQPRNSTLSQSPTTEAPSASGTRQSVQAFGGQLAVFLGHEDWVSSAQFSPDGRQILTASRDKTARLWDTSGNLLVEFRGHKDNVTSAVFSPDGRHILTVSRDQTARLWDTSGNVLAEFRGHEDCYVHSALFSPGGSHILTTGWNTTACLWDTSGNVLVEFRGNEGGVRSAEFSPDGRHILTVSSDKTARLWDTSGNLLVEFRGHKNNVTSAVFSPDGRHILTASWDQTARLWDISGTLLAEFRGHKKYISNAEFSPDGSQILTASWDQTARLWDTSGTLLTEFQGYQKSVHAEFSPDGQQILAVSSDGIAHLWDTKGNLLAEFRGHEHEGGVASAQFSPDGRQIVTVGSFAKTGGIARLWDLSATIVVQTEQITTLQSFGKGVSENNAQLVEFRGHEDIVSSAVFSPDGSQILTASWDKTARLWNPNGSLLAEFQVYDGEELPEHKTPINSAVFSPDGSKILVASGYIAGLWDIKGTLLVEFRGHDGNVKSAIFSPDGSQILTSDGTAYLWNISGELLVAFQRHSLSTYNTVFSPDGSQILTVSYQGTARFWDTSGNLLTELKGYSNAGNSIVFSPDGRQILIAEHKTAHLWDISGNLLAEFRGHEDLVLSAIFSPDGSKILTASSDKTARLWDISGNLLAEFRGHEDLVWSAIFSPDGSKILTASSDKTARLWDVSIAIAAQSEQIAAQQALGAGVSEKNAAQAAAALEEGIKLNQQGTVESRQLALSKLEEALALYRTDKNYAKEAQSLLLIGNIHANLGQFQTALDSYNQALPLSRQSKAEEAAILNSLGQLYNYLAAPDTALDYQNQALPLLYQLNDKGGAATTFNNIGDIQAATGQWENALDSYNQALIISRPAGDLAAEATALTGIGSTYFASQQWETALNAYNQSLIISRYLKDKIKETTILNQMGKIHAASGQDSTARDYFNQALLLAQQLSYKAEEANILYNQATLNRQQKNLTAAKAEIETAINIIEELRTQIASQELRQSYFARNQDYYQFYIDLLMQLHQQNPSQGYDAEALHASERSRARSLLELLTEANADIRQGVEPQLLEQERTLQQQLDAIEKRRVELFSGNYTQEQATAIEQEREQLLSQYQEIQAKIRATSPRYAALTQPEPLTLTEIQQQVLDDDTLLLQYSLGSEHSYLWAVSKTSINSYSLPPREEIEAAAKQFYELLKTPGFQLEDTRGSIRVENVKATKAISQLSQILLAPVAEQLGNKRLLIVSDGALQYIPFSALPLPETSGENVVPLLANNEIVNLPSATTLGILRQEQTTRQTAPKAIAILADPVFSSDDERVKSSKQQSDRSLPQQLLDRSAREADIGVWQRLPGTRTEAEAIMALVPDSERIHGFDFAANREMITNPELSSYRIVHLATHGLLNSTNPELSGVVLSLFDEQGTPQNGFLRLHDVFNLNLPAELVVLSACQTGLGQEIKGEGLVGLTRGFMYAGSPRVLVSLWNVSDAATAEMMSRFYRNMLQEGLSATAALRTAQLEMQQETQWNAPYYWAAFTLQGEWR